MEDSDGTVVVCYFSMVPGEMPSSLNDSSIALAKVFKRLSHLHHRARRIQLCVPEESSERLL